MKRRAERNRDFEAIKSNLFETGIAVLTAAEAHENQFKTSISALAEAMDITETESDVNVNNELRLKEKEIKLREKELELRQREIEFRERELEFKEKELEFKKRELEFKEKEFENRTSEAQGQIDNTKKQIKSAPVIEPLSTLWTERTIKTKFKTLSDACQSLGIEARSWKDAVDKANKKAS